MRIAIVVDLRNSYSRDGKFDVCDFETALEYAKTYVTEKSEQGIFGYAHIMFYFETKTGNRYLDSEITISSKPSGKFTQIGYPIPESKGFVKSLYVSINKGCNRVEKIYRMLEMEEK